MEEDEKRREENPPGRPSFSDYPKGTLTKSDPHENRRNGRGGDMRRRKEKKRERGRREKKLRVQRVRI
ncbi:hypothetical protein AMTR_s00055p00188810 [Amborella trichopoda]|uniref:Uncharacterized protein n=1 Tax=Amborella trichopoda TaxID=13333 RepID=U5D786_AMBTC|nr:hypothetical protein AMTR_s00055p00188810 [Amborella trichopoda]